MSPEPTRLTRVPLPEAQPADVRRGAAVDASTHSRRSSWPVTRGPAIGMTLLLGLSVAGPAFAHNLSSAPWPTVTALLPALLATLAARLVFESVDGVLTARRLLRHLLAGAAGATIGELLMAASARVLALRLSPAIVLLTLALELLALTSAGLVRDLEIRVRLAMRRVFFAGSAESLRELQHELLRSPEASLVGTVGARTPLSSAALAEAVASTHATVLVLDHDAAQTTRIVTAAATLGRSGLHVRDLLGYYEAEFRKVPLTELTPAWFLFERPDQHRRALYAAVRRVVVVLAAGGLLLISLPLIALLALAVRLTSPGPAIFRQPRVGRDGTLFRLVKLRTMTVADDSAAWATDQDHRITPLGRVLRRYRLDELPQLWNVLRGELALVGPRPEQVPIVELLEQQIPFYAVRHTVRPGLTGWAQVNLGYSGSLEGARAKLQRDLYYVKHRSLHLDLLILWLTLEAVFTNPH